MQQQIDKLKQREDAATMDCITAQHVDFETGKVYEKQCEHAGTPCCKTAPNGNVDYRPCACPLVEVGTTKEHHIHKLRDSA